MIQTGFESRVKIQQIIDSQLPEFILDESPKSVDFLKQYYISQEYQGGSIDISDNLDQYLKLDNLTPEVITGFTILSANISAISDTIQVDSTKGFPQKYGLLKIDDEIITYTGITTNTFTGCIRGFSGITNFHKQLNAEELVFSVSDASSHNAESKVDNLSSLFLQEFYKKIKYTLASDLQDINFVSDLNVSNFIKSLKTLYQTKGTEEAFRILFNVLFGETPKIINLENFLIKPSTANYIRRLIVVCDVISGNPLNLEGQTIIKTTDSNTTASVSEVEIIKRKNKTYYKLLLFLGYTLPPEPITGQFNITGSTKNLETISIGSSVITVDSTIGFPQSGIIYSGNNVINYSDKSVNQFFGCSGITSPIEVASIIFSEDTYFGYENGDTSKKVILRITGILSDYIPIKTDFPISAGEKIAVKSIGKIIKNPDTNKTYREIFSNSWIYNTSSRYEIIDDFTPGNTSQIILKSPVDASSLKVGDIIELLYRNTQTILKSNLQVNSISINDSDLYEIGVDDNVTFSSGSRYDIRRKIKTASSSTIPFDYNPITSDIQNVYDDNDYMFIASNSLPSYEITKSLFSYDALGVADKDPETNLNSLIVFSNKVSFFTGDEIYYKPSITPISGLKEGIYYIQVLPGNLQVRLYGSRSVIGTINYLHFGDLTEGIHTFILNSQKERILSAQKILRKFPLDANIGDGESEETPPGSIGMLVNGVEIFNYKTTNKIYYGPLEKVNVLSGGGDYDVINPPNLSLSSGSALIQPCISGSIEKVYVTPQNFDIDVVVSVAITGGNGSGAVFQPIIERKRREIEFDARLSSSGGGVNNTTETITFLTEHNLLDGQEIIYRPLNNTPVGVGTFLGSNTNTGLTLKDGSSYFAKYVNNFTIRLYPSITDYRSGINTIGFTISNAAGIQKFATEIKNTLSEIKVINGGENYKNRKLRVLPSGISTAKDTIYFPGHKFEDGEKIIYSNTGNPLSGLTTEKQYYILKIDDDFFRLSDAGIGGTTILNYERRKFVSLGSTIGSGYHIFNDPEISLEVRYSPVGLDTNQFIGSIDSTPIVKGKITDIYIYEKGSDYGSTILNYQKKPSIIIKNGKEAQCKPIIINGRIEDVSVQYGGKDYYSTPNLNVIDLSGNGKGAVLKPVIENGKLSDVIVINTGIGYSSKDTKIEITPSGKGAAFDVQVRSLSINDNLLFGTIHPTNDSIIPSNEIVKSSYNNLQYGISGYFDKIKDEFGDDGSKHSPIIGWAYDGNPIYGSFGYSNPESELGNVKRLSPGYTLNIDKVFNRPNSSLFPPGFFIEDYEFTNSGDLDVYNGRFCVTKEFPKGTYAYFATTEEDVDGNSVGKYPYFIANRFRSKFVEDNRSLNQSFDFNNSSLIRNTFPYKIGDTNANNDFIIESNEVINQFSVVESITSGSIEKFNIINSGEDYKIGETLLFDQSDTEGGGLISQVSEIKGKSIVDIETSSLSYNNTIFEWENKNQIKVKISPKHDLNNLDYVNVSGLSTFLGSLNGINRIGVTSYTSSLFQELPTLASGIVTDVYLSSIPDSISIGSSITIGSNTLSILNIFNTQNVVRVISVGTVGPHTATTPVYFIPDSFTINKSVNYFDSRDNDLVYFNPQYSIGIGTTVGVDVQISYNVGVQTNNVVSVPTQSIYLPNHPFKTNQPVILQKPALGGSNISVSTTSGGVAFDLPDGGNSQVVYIIKKSIDYIGIVTQIGLTTTTNGLFFRSFVPGSYDYQYSLRSNFNQVKGSVQKNIATVSVSTSHNLSNNDTINLFVKPNLSVGVGSSSSIKVLRDADTEYILFNPIEFNSSVVDASIDTISINSHGLKTGDKVRYSANNVISGLTTGFYFVYKINDNTIKLGETYTDVVQTNPPNTLTFSSTGGSSQVISLVNPPISIIKNNNIIFDLKDSSLYGYEFKIFYDQDFYNEFISTGSTSSFSISKTGTIGVSTTNASLSLNYDSNIPSPLFYSLQKSGYISTADKEVINYSSINYIDSFYSNSYNVFGIGTTTFNICLSSFPEKNSYSVSECDILEYTTSSQSSSGGVSKVKIVSPGSNFKKLPIFNGIESDSGSGAYIIPDSTQIGKINQIRILNEGFEYSSDKTLRPEASISKFYSIKNSNTIDSIGIINAGKNYISSPDLIIVNSDNRNVIDSGLLIPNLSQSGSIESVTIDSPPKGLPETIVTLRTINNTNGVGIKTVQSSSSGIVTCALLTPASGFLIEPFSVGDKIFVEGIQKETTDGSGFNSEDYGYQFFDVVGYTSSISGSSAILTYDLSGITTNPGVPKVIENNYGVVINYNDYPRFNITQDFSSFILGEPVQVKVQDEFTIQDLVITESNENYVKLFGTYDLQSNQIIRGSQSGTIASIDNVKECSGQFKIDYGKITEVGWYDDIGKLNDDTQVISDNDYYQNLSYSIKTNKEWNDIVSPVNNILHPSGLKNFADTQIIKGVNVNSISVNSNQFAESIFTIIEEQRADTVNNYDLVVDVDTFGDRSKYLKFKNKKLSNYFKAISNRVLDIDQINSEFSNSNQELAASSKVTDIVSTRKFNRYLVQISNKNLTEFQFTELIILNNDSEIFILERGTVDSRISSESGYETNTIGDFSGYINNDTDECYLKFEPKDSFVSSYNIKYLNNTFTNSTTGIGTTNIGFVSLIGVTTTVSAGSTVTLLEKSSSVLDSLYSMIHITDDSNGEMNYSEIFVDHDGTNTNISEFYFDTNDGLSSNFIGTFGSFISGGIIKINYTNNSSNNVTIRTKNVGFSTISVGLQTYRFKLDGQIDGFENTILFNSSYKNVSTASTVISLNNNIFSSVKSSIKVSVGGTSALHQVVLVSDGINPTILQYPFLSIGSTLGIGSFGGEISGSELILKFYPDPSFTGNNFEIISFNEIFYRENDYINLPPPDLEYANILESVGVSRYISVNDDDINKKIFALRYQGTSIFAKQFNPSDSSVLNLSTGEFNIPNHFFSTGEELIYEPKSTFIGVAATAVGIGATLNYVGVVTNILPERVYAIKINNDKFKISTREEYANSGISVTFTSLGSGNAHQFEMLKKNEKSIITISNIVQEPISYALLNYTINNGSQVGSSTTTFGLSGISSIRIGDLLKVDSEYMKVINVGLGTSYSGPISFAGTFPLVSVERGSVGSSATTHSNSGIASVYRGSFNIVGSNIYFSDTPQGSLEDQLFDDDDALPESRDYFSGRVFLRKNYDDNKVYDNISEQFTGIGQTYKLTVSGNNIVGLGTSGISGLVFINGIFQTPTTENNPNNNFAITEDQISGISSITFSGITSSNGSVVISESDVNLNQLPRGGLIVSLGSSGGLGYAPLVGASVTAIIGAGGSIVSVGIGTSGDLYTGNWGSGYRSPISIGITEIGHVGSSATITASVGAGGSLSFTIVNGGTGYVSPIINISSPSYSNLPIVGVSRLSVGSTTDCGIGILMDIDVGASSTTGIGSTLFEVKNFKIKRNGYGFEKGDVFKPVGLVTAKGIPNPISEFEITVLDTFTDSFSAWQFGQIDYIDSVKNYQDGSRTRFPLYYNGNLLSFERDGSDLDSQLINFNSLLIIFINGILQNPGESYQFDGGTSFVFTEPPKEEDNVAIYFYRGSSEDSSQILIYETLKIGDDVQVFSNNAYLGITTTQNSRTVTDILTSSTIETNLYFDKGVDSINYKPVSWIKQKTDKFINGNLVSKSRDSIETQIYPTAKIIKTFDENDDEIFVDSISLFNYENVLPGEIDFDALIVSGADDPVSAAVTAVVSAAGTVQSLVITNIGSGYTGSSINVNISSPPKIGAGIGTVATASISIVNGSLSSTTITNPGLGYTTNNPPQVLVPLPSPIYENITNITGIAGTIGTIVGIGTTVGVGTALAINFTINLTGLSTGYPLYVFNTKVGNGVTTILSNNLDIVGIGTTCLDNIYIISGINPSTGVVTCNIHSGSSIVGIATTGVVGKFSWGKISGFNRSSSPISIGISGFTVDSGLSTFPIMQRRGYGLRSVGPIIK
jgi:hypothetical protein